MTEAEQQQAEIMAHADSGEVQVVVPRYLDSVPTDTWARLGELLAEMQAIEPDIVLSLVYPGLWQCNWGSLCGTGPTALEAVQAAHRHVGRQG